MTVRVVLADDQPLIRSGLRVLIADTDDIAAIRVVAAGDALIAPAVTRRLIADFVSGPAPAPARLGRSNSEIAAELYISVATAKAHVARLFTKLDARDRVHLVIIAYEMGLVTP